MTEILTLFLLFVAMWAMGYLRGYTDGATQQQNKGVRLPPSYLNKPAP